MTPYGGRNDMKKKMEALIVKRLKKARRDHHELKWLDRNEFINVHAELMAILYEIEQMEE
jgi:hypothetical protein